LAIWAANVPSSQRSPHLDCKSRICSGTAKPMPRPAVGRKRTKQSPPANITSPARQPYGPLQPIKSVQPFSIGLVRPGKPQPLNTVPKACILQSSDDGLDLFRLDQYLTPKGLTGISPHSHWSPPVPLPSRPKGAVHLKGHSELNVFPSGGFQLRNRTFCEHSSLRPPCTARSTPSRRDGDNLSNSPMDYSPL